MGIDVDHSLLVGCSYDELEDFIQKELGGSECGVEPYEMLNDLFTCASPYYDADIEACFFGFKIPNYCEVSEDWFAEVKRRSEDFERLTGVKPRVRGGAHVW